VANFQKVLKKTVGHEIASRAAPASSGASAAARAVLLNDLVDVGSFTSKHHDLLLQAWLTVLPSLV
jgi:hypothetical protein